MNPWTNVPILRGLWAGANSCTLARGENLLSCSTIFVLIHGTFAAKAPWTKDDSDHTRTLLATEGTPGVCRFEWSGVNGTLGRLTAANVLATELNALQQEFLSASIVIVAHSHGGTIASWALTELDRRIFAAVYINSPFLHVTPRRKYLRVLSAALVGLCLIFSTACVFLLYFLLAAIFPSTPDIIASPILWLIGAASGLIVASKLASTLTMLEQRIVKYSEGIRAASRELAVCVVGDEAVSALGTLSFVQWILSKIEVLSLVLVPLIVLTILSNGHAWDGRVTLWLISITLATFISATGLSLAAIIALGPLHGLLAIRTPISVTPTPLGKIDAMTVRSTKSRGMNHSSPFQDQKVIDSIVDWLTGKP